MELGVYFVQEPGNIRTRWQHAVRLLSAAGLGQLSYPNTTGLYHNNGNLTAFFGVTSPQSGCFPRLHQPIRPVPSRASPPPRRCGSGSWAAAHGRGGGRGSLPNRFSPASARSSPADTLRRRLLWSRDFRSLLGRNGGAATVTCM